MKVLCMFQKVARYFPREITETREERPFFTEENSPLGKSLRKALGQRGERLLPKWMKESLNRSDVIRNVFGHFDKNRTWNGPLRFEHEGKMVDLYETDPFLVIPKYIERAGNRIGVAKTFGAGTNDAQRQLNKVIEHLVENPNQQAFQRNLTDQVLRELAGVPFDGPAAQAAHYAGIFTDITNSLLLSFSQPANAILGLIPATAVGGIKRGLKLGVALAKNTLKGEDVMLDNGWSLEETLEFGRKVRSWTRDSAVEDYGFGDAVDIGQLSSSKARQITGKFAQDVGRFTGLDVINRWLNKYATVMAADVMGGAIDQARNGDVTQLSQLKRYFSFKDSDVDRWLNEPMSVEDMGRVVTLLSARTNLSAPYAD